jgi:hypothetical protein
LQYLVRKGAFIVKEILLNMLMFDYCFKPILQQRGDMWKMVKRILYGSRLYVKYGKKSLGVLIVIEVLVKKWKK